MKEAGACSRGRAVRAVVLIGLVLGLSCSGAGKKGPAGPADLLAKGLDRLADEEYEEALRLFEKVQNEYPASPEAVDAEIKAADCHFARKKYLEAAEGYKTFAKLHPSHPDLAYAYFRTGEAFFSLAPDSVDRDLTNISNSITYMERLRACCPDSKFAADGDKRRREGLRRLGARIVYVGDFYFDRGEYRAAIGRYRQALAEYDQLLDPDEITYKVALCQRKLGDKSGYAASLKTLRQRRSGRIFAERLEERGAPR